MDKFGVLADAKRPYSGDMSPRWATTTAERRHWRQGKTLIAGVDEAGRGALAGPIVAAAVIMPVGYKLQVADSKLLSAVARERLFVTITHAAYAWSVALVEAEQIDADGIDRANEQVVQAAIKQLPLTPDHVFADAVRMKTTPARWESVIDGDATIGVVAAASIIAKAGRDAIMRGHHQRLPQWQFDTHKGYGTAHHFQLLQKHGLSPIHRRSFMSHR